MRRNVFHMSVVLCMLAGLGSALAWSWPVDNTLILVGVASAMWLPWAVAGRWMSGTWPADTASAPGPAESVEDFADTTANWYPVEQRPAHRAASESAAGG